MYKIFLALLLFTSFTFASISPEELVEKYKLDPKEKTSYQWIKLFKDKEWLKKHKLDTLNPEQLNELLDYLIEHAADADVATLPGL